MQTPNPTPHRYDRLFGIDCAGTVRCVAIGRRLGSHVRSKAELVFALHGAHWRALPASSFRVMDNPTGVSCPRPGWCMVVGARRTGKSPSLPAAQVVENSTLTTSDTGLRVRYHGFHVLDAVSCLSATDCFAVGSITGLRDRPLIEHWDGHAWSTMSAPNPGGPPGIQGLTVGSQLHGISCTSTTNCVAVGGTNSAFTTKSGGARPAESTFVLDYDGMSWQTVPTPDITKTPTGPVEDELRTVSCPSPTTCVATGRTFYGNHRFSFIEQRSRESWTLGYQPTNPRLDFVGLECVTGNDCYLTTLDSNGTSHRYNKLRHWNGAAWRVVKTNAPPGSGLNAVSCVDEAHCHAAGSRDVTRHHKPGARTLVLER
jgi:hypothetical protein